MALLIDAYLTPFFPEHESLFDEAAVVMIDVLRASTTVATALKNGAKELIPTDSLEKAVKIYSSLSKEVRFLGGERHGVKPSGFDAGNSPFEYTEDSIKGKSVILTTSNGTRIFQKAKNSEHRIVGAFVNLNAVLSYLDNYYFNSGDNHKVIFLCAGNNGRLSYEDMLCAGAFISNIVSKVNDVTISDPAATAMNLYELHSENLVAYLKSRDHAIILNNLGFADDIDFCFTLDVCPVVPLCSMASIKAFDEQNLN
ncbi:MAG: 2-phosphosulfolactate phosphatase [Candidatus Kapaibacterium sp.]